MRRSGCLINLPIAAGAVALALLSIAETKDDHAMPLDGPGAALAMSGLGELAGGLTLGAGPGGWTLAAMALVVGGATGARVASQAAKELSDMPSGARAILSVCADGGEGTVALLQRV